MPKLLPERSRPESIRRFRSAARLRFDDGWKLAEAGRRTAAIYLWGYTAEMAVKAAYFEAVGFERDRPIRSADLRAAKSTAVSVYGVAWSTTNRHDVSAWARLLVEHRIANGISTGPAAMIEVVRRSDQVYARWRETLRYRTNVAYDHEVRTVCEATDWLLRHSHIP